MDLTNMNVSNFLAEQVLEDLRFGKEITHEAYDSLFINMAVQLYSHYAPGRRTASLRELKKAAIKRGYRMLLSEKNVLHIQYGDLSVKFVCNRIGKRFEVSENAGYGINTNAVQLFDFLELYCGWRDELICFITS